MPSRLTSLQGYDGCYQGYVTDLARHWLDTLTPAERDEVAIFACGPTPMLEAAAAVAVDYDLPCEVSLEEYMACAVGGCAGCAARGAASRSRISYDLSPSRPFLFACSTRSRRGPRGSGM